MLHYCAYSSGKPSAFCVRSRKALSASSMRVSFEGREAPEHPADREVGPQRQCAREGHWHGQARRRLDAFQGLRGEEQPQRGALCPGAGLLDMSGSDSGIFYLYPSSSSLSCPISATISSREKLRKLSSTKNEISYAMYIYAE